jgi:hypothetical protein
MVPITGVAEKKALEIAWDFVRGLWNRSRDLKKRNEVLERHNQALTVKLAEQQSGSSAFERKLTELECRPQDDSIYWSKDGSGAAFCPLCIHGPEKLITPLTHGINRGAYYCALHEQFFNSEELREMRRNYVRPARNWHTLRQRLEAESYRQARRNGQI